MTNEIEMMKCDWCSKDFPADPRACVESGIALFQEPEDGDEWKGEQPITLHPSQMTDDQKNSLKAETGMSDVELDRLLTTGNIDGLGSIICLQCQEQEEES